jgi:hypothetical protein
VIDLSATDRLDFSGFGMLLRCLRRNGIQPVLTGAPHLVQSLQAMRRLDGVRVEPPARRRIRPRSPGRTAGILDLGPLADRAENRQLLNRVAAGDLFWSPKGATAPRGAHGVHTADGKPLSTWHDTLLQQALSRGWVRLDHTVTLTDTGRWSRWCPLSGPGVRILDVHDTIKHLVHRSHNSSNGNRPFQRSTEIAEAWVPPAAQGLRGHALRADGDGIAEA